MLDKLQAVESRFEELCARSEQPDFYSDPKKAAAILRERNDLEPIIEAFRAYKQAQRDLQDAQELMADPEMKELCQQTYQEAKQAMEDLHSQLQILLLPKDPNDDKSVIMEIRGGVGGEESALFAHSLFRMYTMYAQKMGWSVELMNYNETELGGVKEADFVINGRGAYSRLKYESGVHRV
ncbi:MAG: PCRF domain-containing protein, partial [Oscillospiraceae bacterium]|nr:PCRF domain-containing protein [Oscillospiraceae bacterium]